MVYDKQMQNEWILILSISSNVLDFFYKKEDKITTLLSSNLLYVLCIITLHIISILMNLGFKDFYGSTEKNSFYIIAYGLKL